MTDIDRLVEQLKRIAARDYKEPDPRTAYIADLARLRKEAHAEGYAKGIEDAVRRAENCEVTLTGDDPFGNAQIAAAIRALKEGDK